MNSELAKFSADMQKVASSREMISRIQKDLRKNALSLKRMLRQAIMSLPDNPNISRLGKRCFVMNWSNLSSKNWTPEYYDFKMQYRVLCKIIHITPIDRLMDVLNDIIKTGGFKQRSKGLYGRWSYTFNPVVIDYLKILLNIPEEKK